LLSNLAAQGISQAEAQKGYATIADILPTAQNLSDIYGRVRLTDMDKQKQNKKYLISLASAQRKTSST
jgi:hypothetical protein